MEGIERVLLKMLPNQEGRNKYFILLCRINGNRSVGQV